MSCCPPYVQPYSNAALVIIPFGTAMIAKYGIAPNIKVYTYDEDTNEYVIMRFLSARIVGNEIIVEIGGLGTGYIKIF